MEDTLETLVELVKKEAKTLRGLATEEERSNLSEARLLPDRITKCIYGLMTGHCNSDRASELIINCAEKVYNIEEDGFIAGARLNGVPHYISNRCFHYVSPIEKFIIICGLANISILIKYLKGRTQHLDFIMEDIKIVDTKI